MTLMLRDSSWAGWGGSGTASERGAGGGFTLVEVLVGGLILAVGAVAICGLSRHCLQNNVRGQYYEQAYRLLDECLDRVAALGIDIFQGEKQIEGESAQGQRNYRYVVRIEPSEQNGLYEATATVTWQESRQDYEVSTATLIYVETP